MVVKGGSGSARGRNSRTRERKEGAAYIIAQRTGAKVAQHRSVESGTNEPAKKYANRLSCLGGGRKKRGEGMKAFSRELCAFSPGPRDDESRRDRLFVRGKKRGCNVGGSPFSLELARKKKRRRTGDGGPPHSRSLVRSGRGNGPPNR